MSRDGIDVTLVAWLKLGEFLLCSVELISESGRDTEPAALTGEPLGVLLMRSGDTCHGID
jgi:hypothetical protein